MKKPYLHGSFLNERTGKVRHILIDEENGAVWFSAGVEGKLSSGTQNNPRQTADQWGQAWVKDEGFTRTTDVQPPPEPLEHAVKLAKRLGHTDIFDSPVSAGMREQYKGKKLQLEDWESMQAKNGGSHKYAVTPRGITAEPQPSGKTKHFPFAD